MGDLTMVKRGLDLLRMEWPSLAVLVLSIDLPPILGEAISVGGGYLSADVATPLWALLALVLLPLSHGATLLLLKGRYDRQPTRVRDALRGGIAVWGKYQVAYLYMSFLILGWAVVFLAPGLILMMILSIKQVWMLAPFGLAGVAYAILPLVFQEPYFVTLGTSPWEARLKSRALVKGRWGLILRLSAMTMLVPLMMEYGGDLLLGVSGLETGPLSVLLKAGFGTLAAFLYIVPAAVFYVLFRDLTDEGGRSAGKS